MKRYLFLAITTSFMTYGIPTELPSHAVALFMQPRSITNDLTYRNSATFFQRFRGAASCSFFTFDSTFIFERSRKTAPCCLKHGAEWHKEPWKLEYPDRFPKPAIVSWLPQIIFDFDYFCPGLWADAACAFTHATYSFTHSTSTLRSNHIGVEDVQLRVGLRLNYCEDDMISFYLLGNIPTRREQSNFCCQPQIGSRTGSVGGGVMYDNTWWYSEFSDSEVLFMTELKILYRLRSSEWRLLQLNNNPPAQPQDPTQRSRFSFWRTWVAIDPRPTIEWWIAVHYDYCGWGGELAYNLWWRDSEDFSSSKSCPNPSGSITPPAKKELINAGGSEALSHTFSGTAIYQGSVCETPLSVAGGIRYEITDLKRPFLSLENWGIFLKVSVSC